LSDGLQACGKENSTTTLAAYCSSLLGLGAPAGRHDRAVRVYARAATNVPPWNARSGPADTM
jgi:hypothetical protein